MRTLIVSNTNEFNESLKRYLGYKEFRSKRVLLYTFNDLRIMSREILEMDFIVTEAYRLEVNSIDDYGLGMFLSFLKNGKKGILLHIDRIENSGLGIRDFLFKIPGRMGELMKKIEIIKSKEKIELSGESIKLLKESFPYRVVKDHHSGHGR